MGLRTCFNQQEDTIILLETGSIDRFAAAGNFASYARCVDSQHMSNGKKKGEGNTKNGNKYLAWAFVEAANFALRFNAEAKRFYERKKAKTNVAVATPADQMGAHVDCFPTRAAFPVTLAGRHPHLHFRGLLRLHSRCGLLARSAAQGDLCHEASVWSVTRPPCSSATRPIDSYLGRFFLHW